MARRSYPHAPKSTTPEPGRAEERANEAVDVAATDDQAPPVAEEAAPGTDAQPAEPAPEPEKSAEDDPHERIVSRYRAEREERIARADKEPVFVAPGAEPPAVEEPAPAPEADEPKLKIKVDGKEIELPQSEVLRRAQLSTAVDERERRLSELNTALDARRIELDRLSRTAPGTGTNGDRPQPKTPAEPAPAKQTRLDPARRRELAERLQAGTPEEAEEALEELIALVSPEPTEPVDVRAAVKQEFALHEEVETINEAISDLGREYPDIGKSRMLQTAIYEDTVSEMLADIGAAGLSRDKLTKLATYPADKIADVHREFRERRLEDGKLAYPMVRQYRDVLFAAGKNVMGELEALRGKAAPAAEAKPGVDLSARTEAKRGLTPQPKASGTRAQPPAPPSPAASRSESYRLAIREDAAARKGRPLA